MGRFNKFINSSDGQDNNRKKDSQDNSFKRKRRGKRIYKTQQKKDVFMKNMENNKGATIQQFNILSVIKKKPKNNKKIKKDKKKFENGLLSDKAIANKDEKEFMKQYLVKYYEEQIDEEDENEIIADTSLKKPDNIISF